jgi:hypothetical protein
MPKQNPKKPRDEEEGNEDVLPKAGAVEEADDWMSDEDEDPMEDDDIPGDEDEKEAL